MENWNKGKKLLLARKEELIEAKKNEIHDEITSLIKTLKINKTEEEIKDTIATETKYNVNLIETEFTRILHELNRLELGGTLRTRFANLEQIFKVMLKADRVMSYGVWQSFCTKTRDYIYEITFDPKAALPVKYSIGSTVIIEDNNKRRRLSK